VPVLEDGAGKAPVAVLEDGAGKAPVPVLEDRAGKARAPDDRLVGYTLLNRYSEDVNYSHWHIIVPGLRARGLSTALYPYRIEAYFDLAPIERLIHQTRTTNVGMNRVLDRFIPVAETKYIEAPDGFAAPGEFRLRFVSRADIPRLFARAAELHNIPSPR